jgi:hypothetical protein
MVLPTWRDAPLSEIRHGDLQQWVSGLSMTGGTRKGGTGLSPSRVIQAYRVVSGVLKYAIHTDRIVKNVADGVELPSKRSAPRRYLTHKQLQRLAAKTDRF